MTNRQRRRRPREEERALVLGLRLSHNDASKHLKGRKIHALVDSGGLPIRVGVHSAAIQDRDGTEMVLDKRRKRFSWFDPIWADGGHNAWQVAAEVAKVPPCGWRSSNAATT
jgi:hypothetical protein